MSRPATGQVIELSRRRGRAFALRFRAYGKRHYVSLEADVTTRSQAEEELANVLADVRRGIWIPPTAPEPPEFPDQQQTFHEFASTWFGAREAEGLAAKTLVDLRWSLSNHLLPFFASYPLSAMTPQLVDTYKVAKARERAEIERIREETRTQGEKLPRERGLSNGSINHTLRHLAQILETAVEYGLIPSNPATGKRRRLKAAKPARPWVEPEQLMALLDATGGVGHVLLSVLAGAGLRIGEALSLRWNQVDIGTGTLYVLDSKTPKGVREVHLTPSLRETLALWRADARRIGPNDYVFHTSTGGRIYSSNLRRDVLWPAIAKANAILEEIGIAPIGPITFHSLRRTYASLRCACGDDVRYTADQIGHEDPRFTLRVYTQATKRRDRLAKPQRDAFDRAIEWAAMGSTEDLDAKVLQEEKTQNPA